MTLKMVSADLEHAGFNILFCLGKKKKTKGGKKKSFGMCLNSVVK